MFGVTCIQIGCRGDYFFEFLRDWGGYTVTCGDRTVLSPVEATVCFNIGGEIVLGNGWSFFQYLGECFFWIFQEASDVTIRGGVFLFRSSFRELFVKGGNFTVEWEIFVVEYNDLQLLGQACLVSTFYSW